MALVLQNIHDNVVAGILDARKIGLKIDFPKSVTVDMAINSNGCPCFGGELAAGRFQATLKIKPPQP